MEATTYPVHKIDKGTLQITGKGTSSSWDKAIRLKAFTYPWRNEKAPETTFQALWDEDYFYFLFRAEDDAILTKTDPNLSEEREVIHSDRVEIFFKADDDMNPYYSLEMDALGRILDTEGRYYRQIDLDWTWPSGHLDVIAARDEKGYWVEGKISFESLRMLGMFEKDHLKAGLYRGEYIPLENGQQEVKWISWIQPDSETPDFHIPSSFGTLQLIK